MRQSIRRQWRFCKCSVTLKSQKKSVPEAAASGISITCVLKTTDFLRGIESNFKNSVFYCSVSLTLCPYMVFCYCNSVVHIEMRNDGDFSIMFLLETALAISAPLCFYINLLFLFLRRSSLEFDGRAEIKEDTGNLLIIKHILVWNCDEVIWKVPLSKERAMPTHVCSPLPSPLRPQRGRTYLVIFAAAGFT